MLRFIMLFMFVISAASLKAEIKIVAFAGSTRDGSVNKKLALQAANIAREMGAEVTFIDLKDFPIPFYNGDDEVKSGQPEHAKYIRSLMIQSSGIIIASPEYNGSVTALLKNVIDWASRSEDGYFSREAFQGKKFVLLSASPGPSGGVHGLVQLKSILEYISGKVLPKQVSVPDAYIAFDEQNNLKDLKMETALKEAVKQLID